MTIWVCVGMADARSLTETSRSPITSGQRQGENLDSVDGCLVGDLDAGLRLYDSFKEKNQKVAPSMIGAIVRVYIFLHAVC